MAIFDRVKIRHYKRSAFKLSHSVRTSMNLGEVVPSMAIEMVPGDTFRFGQVATMDFTPFVSPFYGEFWQESLAFFVSYDSLKMGNESRFTDMLASVTDPQHDAVPIPKWNLAKTTLDSDSKMVSTHKGKLWDKFGFPLNLPATISDDITPIAYLQRAYNMIWNEFIRDENQDTEISLDNNDVLTCCYKKDYFTSAFDSPQKGTAPYLELTGTAGVEFSSDIVNEIAGKIVTLADSFSTSSQGTIQKIAKGSTVSVDMVTTNGKQDIKTSGSSTSVSSGTAHNSELGLKLTQDLINLLNQNTLQLNRIVTFNIDDLRLLNKLQEWLERLQIAGTRTKEFLLANYGIAPSDETLQRPQFLGRLRSPVNVTTTIAQAETSALPQGHKTGNGKSVNSVLFHKWTCKEPGVLMVVSFCRPKASYHQGINRMWIKKTVYDYFNPIFENLGQQPIYKGELYCTGTSTDLEFFGYTDRYNEMKYIPDITTGDLRGNVSGGLKTWSVQRTFGSLPTLSNTFFHVNPLDYDYLFAIPSTNQAQIRATFDNVVKAIRPLHRFALPSL